MLPQQYADFATLRGDNSDGLPGVAGVGDKTAASLLLSYGDLAGVRAAAADPDSALGPGPRSKIIAAADYLDVAPTVVAVARDIDLGERRPRPPGGAGRRRGAGRPRRAVGLVQPRRAPHRRPGGPLTGEATHSVSAE